ncbi:MAG: hypothetical protein ABIP53_05655 [Candidatus Limnocylindrales bacterium]
MAKDSNPFARAVGAKSEAKSDAVREAGTELRRRQSDEELQQAANDGGDNDDVPSSVADNADDQKQVGSEFGLGNADFVSARDRVEGADPVDDAAEDVDQTTFVSAQERIARGSVNDFNIGGTSVRNALSAASGDDNTDVGDLATLDPRDLADAAKADRNALNDPLTAAMTGLLNQQANSAATNPFSVAQGTDTLGAATNAAQNMTDKEKADFAASLGVTPTDPGGKSSGRGSSGSFGDASAATPTAPPEDKDDGKGIVDSVVDMLKSLAKPPEDGGRLQAELKGTDAGGDVGTVQLREAQEKQGIQNLETAVGSTLGGIAGSKGTGSVGSGAGGGAKLTDPDDDRSPPTDAEIAFAQAMKDQLGIRRIPGDIDPGDGDGTQGGTPVGAGAAAAIVGTRSQNSLVGNPGTAAGGGSSPIPTPGNPGLGGSDKGGDIDFEDGSGFTGGVRTTGPEDIDFGVGNRPLIGLGGNSDDEADDDDDDDGSGKGGD